MAGYYKRPDATNAMYRDGWLCSGDLGYRDAAGNYYITGRKKDIIVLSSGKNIYPEEIEAHYLQSPNIKEVCVLGLQSAPGEPFSERLHAVIVPDFEALRRARIVNVGDMLRFEIESLSAKVPSTKRILSYEIWQDDLPRTTTRKIKRFEVEQRVKRGEGTQAATTSPRELTPEETEWTQLPNISKALGIILAASKLKKDALLPSDNLELDLGLDSMERVELLVSLDQQMGASVPDSVASEIYTVRDLVDAVIAHAGSANHGSSTGWADVINEPPGETERDTIDHDHPYRRACGIPLTAPCANNASRPLSSQSRRRGEAAKVRAVHSLPQSSELPRRACTHRLPALAHHARDVLRRHQRDLR